MGRMSDADHGPDSPTSSRTTCGASLSAFSLICKGQEGNEGERR